MSLSAMRAAACPAQLARTNAGRLPVVHEVVARAVAAGPLPPCGQSSLGRRRRPRAAAVVAAAAAADKPSSPPPANGDEGEEDEGAWFEGLTPEEDAEIPGGYAEAMSASTRLGKAIRSACDELDALAALEDEALREADALLGKLGVKGSLFGAAASGLGAEGGPRDALAALKRAAEEEAEAQAAHERAAAARQEAAGGEGAGGGGAK